MRTPIAASALALLAILRRRRTRRQRRVYVRQSHLAHQEARFQLFEQYYQNSGELKLFLRFNREDFDRLHEILKPDLVKKANHRFPLTSKQRLAVFLRFVAHGASYRGIETTFGIGKTTVIEIIRTVTATVINRLRFPCPTTAEWLQIAHDFERKWHFPQCIGGVDGKYFAIDAPTGEGSVYYNHKFFHSIIGLAWVDANYKLIFFDVGSPGRCSDAGVYKSSPVAAKIRSGQAGIPNDRPLGSYDLPFVFVADQGFKLSKHVLRPFSQRDALRDKVKNEFNYRLSRARRVTENCFGILVNRFRILRSPLGMDPDNARNLIVAVGLLHNYLRSAEIARNETPQDIVEADAQDIATDMTAPATDDSMSSRQLSQEASEIRNKFADYFFSPEGRVTFRNYE
ncbi:hypothetical protein QR680_007118 [Steinernema hermaphroditum]|uniref:DDE Tnp4 domain-containing protein n=1 Tax=Steinernema hermaphroditum TaxID=289476 RepID=A0AA39HXN2_9BILA|nr:hypothetical protein QR680_007118 [Steinernema hermaphroditum]